MHLCAAGWDLYQRARLNKNPALLCRIAQQAINKSIFYRYSIWMALLNWTDIWMLSSLTCRYYANLTSRNRFTTNKLTSHEVWEKVGTQERLNWLRDEMKEKGKQGGYRRGGWGEKGRWVKTRRWQGIWGGTLRTWQMGLIIFAVDLAGWAALICGESCSWCEGEERKSQEKEGVIKKREQ